MTTPRPEPGFNDYATMNAEYLAAVRTMPLACPPSFTFPAAAPGDPDAPVIYEIGRGTVSAYLLAVEAIEEAAVDAHRAGRPLEAARWLNAAAQWPKASVFQKYNDHDVPVSWFDDVIGPALHGDFSRLCALVDGRRAYAANPW